MATETSTESRSRDAYADTTSFALKIFTPAGLQLEERVLSVTLPTVDGEIGILPQHVRYVGLLGIGVFEYVSARTNQAMRAVVSGGFCTFSDGVLELLADSYDTVESVDVAVYSAERGALQQTLQSSSIDDHEGQIAAKKLARIEAIEKLLGRAAH